MLILFFCFLVLSGGRIYSQNCNPNYLNAVGNKLYDSNGKQVRLTGVNWFGFETSMLYFHGIWSRDMKSMLKQIKDQGFNCIRIPWCNKILDPSATININSYGVDPYTGVSPMNALESTKKKPIEILDIAVQWCQENNMKIILDNHSRNPDGYMAEELWYTSSVSESKWIADWVSLAQRYKNYDAVVAMDLNNEPHGKYGSGASWGNSNPATDWNKAAERCGNAILAVNPNVLIMVEGIESYNNTVYWWGGNLQGVSQYPVQLSNPKKLVYSPHEYGPTVWPQPWFTSPEFPGNMASIWTQYFHFIYQQGISPLFVGEFGIRDRGGKDEVWFDTFLSFMGNIYSWTFWCWNPNSGDTGGLLDDQWKDIVTWKMNKLKPYLAAEIPNCGGSSNQNTPPDAVISASPVSGTAPVNVNFNAGASIDPDGTIINYSWNFGDGSTGSGVTILHNYSSPGTFNAVLTVTDNEGATDQAGVTIQVGSTGIPVTGVSVAPTSASVAVNGTQQLTATVAPANATNKTVTWTSSGTAIATVSSSGLVTGLTAGSAVITVRTQDGGFTATSTITVTSVNIPVTGVSVSPTSISVGVNGTQQLTATVAPANATNKTVTWTTNSTAIATVSSSGLVTGRAAGNAVITVRTQDGGLTATCAVTVEDGGPQGCDNPVTISIPFVQNGAGEYCWVTTTAIAYINSWNLSELTINGVDYTNVWSNNLPPAQNGQWTIHYVGNFAWSHFEAPAAKDASEISLLPSDNIIIFPNPFQEVFFIDLKEETGVTRIEVFNSLGSIVEIIENGNITNGILSLEINSDDHLFFVRIHKSDGILTRLIIRE